jgi:glucan phosphoethanolaminetransferase (alkaline phosphatase superfamily)
MVIKNYNLLLSFVFSILLSIILFSADILYKEIALIIAIVATISFFFSLFVYYALDLLPINKKYLIKILVSAGMLIALCYNVFKLKFKYILLLSEVCRRTQITTIVALSVCLVFLVLFYYATRKRFLDQKEIDEKNYPRLLICLVLIAISYVAPVYFFLVKKDSIETKSQEISSLSFRGVANPEPLRELKIWCDINQERQSFFDNLKQQIIEPKNQKNKKPLPNVVMIMIDSLRRDRDNSEIMPFLHKQPGIHAANNWSAANCTHFGLASVFTSLYPIFYGNLGGLQELELLKVFKSLNYNISVMDDKLTTKEHLSNWMKVYFPYLFSHAKKDNNSFFYRDTNSPFQKHTCNSQVDFDKLYNKRHDEEETNRPNLLLLFLMPTQPQSYCYMNDLEWQNTLHTQGYSSKKKEFLRKLNKQIKDGVPISKKVLLSLANNYNKACKFADQFIIKKVIESLKKKDLYDNSIIIIYGDHGEEHGQKGSFLHGKALNVYQLGSMLYMKFPNMKDKHIINAPTSTIDILPTIIDYFNKEYKYNIVLPAIYKQQGFGGMSLFDNIPNDRVLHSFQCGNIVPSKGCIIKNNTVIELDKSFDRSEIEAQ